MLGSSSFSPDGRFLTISEGRSTGNLHVFTLSLKSGRLARVTASALWDSAPDWGPR